MKLSEYVKNLLFPPKCLCCGEVIGENTVFCEKCLPEIGFTEGECCKVCGIPLNPHFESPICARCRSIKPYFERNFPVMEHTGMGRRAVLNVKYGKRSAIPPAARLIADKLIENKIFPDAVTFVPETDKSKRKRGYPVTEMLSFYTARYLGAEHIEALEKIRETKKQKELTASQRKINVLGAYKLKDIPIGKSILIIDDVFTTGATMNECAKTIKKKFNGKIYTATITIRDRE